MLAASFSSDPQPGEDRQLHRVKPDVGWVSLYAPSFSHENQPIWCRSDMPCHRE